jgi:hypothetical protein
LAIVLNSLAGHGKREIEIFRIKAFLLFKTARNQRLAAGVREHMAICRSQGFPNFVGI